MNVVFFGCSSVGQKRIVIRYCYNEFTENIVSMIGCDFLTKMLGIGGNQVKLQIWMIPANNYRLFSPQYVRNAHYVLIVFSLTISDSFLRAILYNMQLCMILIKIFSLDINLILLKVK